MNQEMGELREKIQRLAPENSDTASEVTVDNTESRQDDNVRLEAGDGVAMATGDAETGGDAESKREKTETRMDDGREAGNERETEEMERLRDECCSYKQKVSPGSY